MWTSRQSSRIRVYWLVGVFLFVYAIVCYFDRLVIAIAGPVLSKEFGWSKAMFGVVLSAFGIGYAITQMPGGWFADRFGPKRVLFWGGLGWAVTAFLTPFMRNVSQMALVRGVLGATEGVFFPSATSALGRWIPKRSYAYFVGLLYSGNKIGALIGTPLMAWMVASYGWKSPFWFCGTLSLVLTLGLWRVGRWILNHGHRFPLLPEILVTRVRSVIQTATQIKLQFRAALASSR